MSESQPPGQGVMSTGVYAYRIPKPVVVEPLEEEWLAEARRQGLARGRGMRAFGP